MRWLFVGALLLACGEEVAKREPPEPTRALPEPRQERVVSLTPAASHLLLAIGAGATIVGVDEVSGRIPELSALPVLALGDAAEVEPDLVLVGELSPAEDAVAERLRARGIDVVEAWPHDFDDAFELCRGVGARLVGEPSARAFEQRLARELAMIGGSVTGPRPRVAAIVGVAPLEFASAHSFATDLLEIAGGTNVTHELPETDDPRITLTLGELRALAPDLLLSFTPRELSEDERLAVRDALPPGYPVEFFVFDGPARWMRDSVEAARALRALLQPHALELERAGRGMPSALRREASVVGFMPSSAAAPPGP